MFNIFTKMIKQNKTLKESKMTVQELYEIKNKTVDLKDNPSTKPETSEMLKKFIEIMDDEIPQFEELEEKRGDFMTDRVLNQIENNFEQMSKIVDSRKVQ